MRKAAARAAAVAGASFLSSHMSTTSAFAFHAPISGLTKQSATCRHRAKGVPTTGQGAAVVRGLSWLKASGEGGGDDALPTSASDAILSARKRRRKARQDAAVDNDGGAASVIIVPGQGRSDESEVLLEDDDGDEEDSYAEAPAAPAEEEAPKPPRTTFAYNAEGNRVSTNMDDLGADVAKLKRRRAEREAAGDVRGDGGIVGKAKNVVQWLLVFDFFVVLSFLGWFLVGVGMSYGPKDTFLLDKFNEYWTPLVQPALGILMGGTIVGGSVSKLTGGDDENGRG